MRAELSSLNMRWYPIPAVCALDMTLGGITYTAVPFNGEHLCCDGRSKQSYLNRWKQKCPTILTTTISWLLFFCHIRFIVGWYANTEVLRDLTDEGRYNMLVTAAKALGMDADTKPGDAPLWIDDVMAILSKAVYHSFKASKIAMIDHHNLINVSAHFCK